MYQWIIKTRREGPNVRISIMVARKEGFPAQLTGQLFMDPQQYNAFKQLFSVALTNAGISLKFEEKH